MDGLLPFQSNSCSVQGRRVIGRVFILKGQYEFK
jgi:hypothetical protein